MITYNVDGVKMPKIKKRDTNAWIRKVAASHGRKVGEVGYMFVDDEKILEVNNEYLGHDYYTMSSTAISSSRSTRCAPMPKSSVRPMTRNFIVSSSMASCTFVVSTTKDQEREKLWRRMRIRLSHCSKVLPS